MKFTFEPDDIDILEGIVEESSEHLNGIEEGVLKLEAEFDPNQLDAVFRAMHSVKGVASFVDFVPIKDTAHSLESFLTDMKKGIYTINSELTDLMLRGIDILDSLVRQLGLKLRDIEAEPPKESFAMEVDDYGFREFVEQAEKMRQDLVQIAEDNNNDTASDLQNAQDPDLELPEPVVSVMKLEIGTFLQQAWADFTEEVGEHLDSIESNCVELEKHPGNQEKLNAILRSFHSIKGGAGVILSMRDDDSFGLLIKKIESLTHTVETMLQSHRNQGKPLSEQAIDLILASVDRTAEILKMLREETGGDISIDELRKMVEALILSEKDITRDKTKDETPSGKLPRQLSAFINITSQALDSMENIITTARESDLVDKKRVKQYIRALNSIISSSRYLNYDDLIQVVEEQTENMKKLVPGETIIDKLLLDQMYFGHQEIKILLKQRISSVQKMMEEVPEGYADKKIGEILLAGKKIKQEDLNGALSKQKKIGKILLDSGLVQKEDIETALTQQAIAREKRETIVEEQSQASTDVSAQSIRVSQDKMNRLMNMIGELLISKNRIFHLAEKIGVDLQIPAMAREVKDVAGEVARIADELQDAIMSARMVPLRILFQRYPRTIRDISRKAGKKLDLIIEGEETELDKTVIEAINDPLVHMLRNAADHGIESPEQRESKGKEPQGKIYLKARYQGNHVVIEISDDGKGMDPDEIKAKALKKGLIKPEHIESMTNDEAYQLVFTPGFSTRDEVSELSGRGVGMDVVKSNIEKVGGSINMSSMVDVGSTFTLRIPLSMSIIRGLMVKCSGQSFIIPLEYIEETVKLPLSDIRKYKNILVADIRGEIQHLIYLKDILGISGEDDTEFIDERVSIVTINVDGNRFGLLVDSFRKEQEFVVKSLLEELASLKIYTGATIQGDGSVVLIINPAQLFQVFLNMGDEGGSPWQ
jgi:two-component system chemotaxis sensor kinase CheA